MNMNVSLLLAFHVDSVSTHDPGKKMTPVPTKALRSIKRALPGDAVPSGTCSTCSTETAIPVSPPASSPLPVGFSLWMDTCGDGACSIFAESLCIAMMYREKREGETRVKREREREWAICVAYAKKKGY